MWCAWSTKKPWRNHVEDRNQVGGMTSLLYNDELYNLEYNMFCNLYVKAKVTLKGQKAF